MDLLPKLISSDKRRNRLYDSVIPIVYCWFMIESLVRPAYQDIKHTLICPFISSKESVVILNKNLETIFYIFRNKKEVETSTIFLSMQSTIRKCIYLVEFCIIWSPCNIHLRSGMYILCTQYTLYMHTLSNQHLQGCIALDHVAP